MYFTGPRILMFIWYINTNTTIVDLKIDENRCKQKL